MQQLHSTKLNVRVNNYTSHTLTHINRNVQVMYSLLSMSTYTAVFVAEHILTMYYLVDYMQGSETRVDIQKYPAGFFG